MKDREAEEREWEKKKDTYIWPNVDEETMLLPEMEDDKVHRQKETK